MGGKGGPSRKPEPGGLNELDFSTAEGDVPHTYFAGVAKLPVAWIMDPVIAFTKPTPNEAGGKGK